MRQQGAFKANTKTYLASSCLFLVTFVGIAWNVIFSGR